MGRIRRIKREARERRLFENYSQVDRSLVGFVFFIVPTGLLVWGYFLLEETFISNRFIVPLMLIGSIAGILILWIILRKDRSPIWVIILIGLLWGTSMPLFGITAINYYGQSENELTVTLDIIKTGNHRWRKFRRCRLPYAQVEFDGVRRKIRFNCRYENTIKDYRYVQLTVTKGPLGFNVIIGKKLKI